MGNCYVAKAVQGNKSDVGLAPAVMDICVHMRIPYAVSGRP